MVRFSRIPANHPARQLMAERTIVTNGGASSTTVLAHSVLRKHGGVDMSYADRIANPESVRKLMDIPAVTKHKARTALIDAAVRLGVLNANYDSSMDAAILDSAFRTDIWPWVLRANADKTMMARKFDMDPMNRDKYRTSTLEGAEGTIHPRMNTMTKFTMQRMKPVLPFRPMLSGSRRTSMLPVTTRTLGGATLQAERRGGRFCS